MTRRILIAGSGFAGMWAALSAARAVSLTGGAQDVEIAIVSPRPRLDIRPRFYEQAFEEMSPDIAPLLNAVGIRHIAGTVETLRTDEREVAVVDDASERSTLPYDRFVLATGSELFIPEIPGIREHSFNVDKLESAMALDRHLRSLAEQPDSVARNTVVIGGGGFTGVETAAEIPSRLREILGKDAATRVIVLEQAPHIGPDLGPGPRPIIERALAHCGVEIVTSAGIVAIDEYGVETSKGDRIETNTVIWTAGMRAHQLAAQIGGGHDRLGRVHADRYLRARDVQDVFVAGDVAMAATDDEGNSSLMSCQHALSLGRVAGYNSAADLLSLPLHPYRQPKYVTCLDLGPWGAVYTEGWDRQVYLQGREAKDLKRMINTQLIYPPAANRDAAFAVANPDFVIV